MVNGGWQAYFSFDVSSWLFNIVLLGLAYIIALPIGIERAKYQRSAGLRTFPIVSMVSCGFLLVGYAVMESSDEAISRVFYGIITGIGFIGGGAILKHKTEVLGSATAASIWAAGAIGVAVASGVFEIAITLSIVTTFTLLLFARPTDSDVKIAREKAAREQLSE